VFINKTPLSQHNGLCCASWRISHFFIVLNEKIKMCPVLIIFISHTSPLPKYLLLLFFSHSFLFPTFSPLPNSPLTNLCNKKMHDCIEWNVNPTGFHPPYDWLLNKSIATHTANESFKLFLLVIIYTLWENRNVKWERSMQRVGENFDNKCIINQ